uniref:Uncharacterized protein n=1 Tax=Cacopsylla melanoneura TaxID=428564 RepID=A0A8D9FG69_9HEMI
MFRQIILSFGYFISLLRFTCLQDTYCYEDISVTSQSLGVQNQYHQSILMIISCQLFLQCLFSSSVSNNLNMYYVLPYKPNVSMAERSYIRIIVPWNVITFSYFNAASGTYAMSGWPYRRKTMRLDMIDANRVRILPNRTTLPYPCSTRGEHYSRARVPM